MIKALIIVFILWVSFGAYLIIETDVFKEPKIEKIDYTISISKGIVTVRNVDNNNEVIGHNILDSLSIIIINDNK